MNAYPTKEIEEHTKKTRKFGLGMMGFADMLSRLRIKYDSEEGLEMADKLMAFIKNTAYQKSSELAEKRGPLSYSGKIQNTTRPKERCAT